MYLKSFSRITVRLVSKLFKTRLLKNFDTKRTFIVENDVRYIETSINVIIDFCY